MSMDDRQIGILQYRTISKLTKILLNQIITN